MHYCIPLLCGFLIFMMTSCEKEGILLDSQFDDVEFKATGTINGTNFDMSSNTVMLTNTATTASGILYSGQLFSDCPVDMGSSCEKSLAIELVDSDPVQYNSDGYPVAIEPGLKTVGQQVIYSSLPQFCIQNIGPASSYVNFIKEIVAGDEYCFEPQAIYPNFEVVDLTATNPAIDSTGYSVQQQQVMVSVQDDQVLWYYFKINCTTGSDSCILLDISIEGNTGFQLQDFAFSLQANFVDIFSPIKISLSDPSTAPELFFSAYHLATGQITNFGFIQLSILPAIPIFDCTSSFSYSSVDGLQGSELGEIKLTYTDPKGKRYTSQDVELGMQTFIINMSMPYLKDGAGNETVVSYISYTGEMRSNDGEVITFDQVDMTFAFGYPGQ
jgi:hypothetical protein